MYLVRDRKYIFVVEFGRNEWARKPAGTERTESGQHMSKLISTILIYVQLKTNEMLVDICAGPSALKTWFISLSNEFVCLIRRFGLQLQG